jgi:surface antigen
MVFHRCAICQPDGTVVVQDVTVALEEPPRGEKAAWYGTITVTHLAGLVAGQRYRLVLDDGRSGEFTVRRSTFAGETSRAVAIHGTGPLG